MESKLPNTISEGHGSPSVPKSKKSDDMSKILDTATRIFDQYMEKWPLVVFRALSVCFCQELTLSALKYSAIELPCSSAEIGALMNSHTTFDREDSVRK